MSETLILQAISKHVVLTRKEQHYFTDLLQKKRIKKRQYLLHTNEICTISAFVIKGCLRSYTIDANGFEHILQFAPPGWWISDMYSLISKHPGHLNIDALEDTDVILLTRTDQEKLFISIPKFERFFRIITENALVVSHQRVLDNMSLKAEERYAVFCKRYPSLIECLPQKQVASYIGVTPEFLSKMKAALLKKKKRT